MSHFSLLAIIPVPQDEEDADTFLDQLRHSGRSADWILGSMAYYDENMRYPAYEVACECGEWRGRMEARAKATEITGLSIHELRKTFKPGPDPDAVPSRLWEAHIKPLMDEEERQFAMMDTSPTPDCSECHGTGKTTSRYNPNSKWDGWTIGGRWSGMMFEDSNIDLIKNRKPDMHPFAFLMPDGHWVERGNMGWWGIVSDGKDEEVWIAERENIYEQFGDAVGMLIDCHI